jgi:ATP-binding cassette subfamily B protein
LSVSYFDSTPSGDIMSRSINDVDNIGQTLSQYLGNAIYWIFMIVSMLIVMFLVNPIFALISIALIPVSMGINILLISKLRPYFMKQQKSLGELNGFIEENISATKIISLFKMKNKTAADFAKINADLTRNSIIGQSTSNILMPINIFTNNMSFVLIASVGVVGLFNGGIKAD